MIEEEQATCTKWKTKKDCKLLFVNKILIRIIRAKRDANGEWRRLRNEELHNLYRSPNIVRVLKSRILRWVCHVARIEEMSSFKILTSKPR